MSGGHIHRRRCSNSLTLTSFFRRPLPCESSTPAAPKAIHPSSPKPQPLIASAVAPIVPRQISKPASWAAEHVQWLHCGAELGKAPLSRGVRPKHDAVMSLLGLFLKYSDSKIRRVCKKLCNFHGQDNGSGHVLCCGRAVVRPLWLGEHSWQAYLKQ